MTLHSSFSHFLIGPPGSGKSTFAVQLLKLDPNAVIVSTDQIRRELFGDEGIQGDWSIIEQQVIARMLEAFLARRPVIYDATNAKRDWRLSILRQVADKNVQWIAWHLQTPLSVCQVWNKQRHRQVPFAVIEELYQALQDNPPHIEEGFVAVKELALSDKEIDWVQVEQMLIHVLAR